MQHDQVAFYRKQLCRHHSETFRRTGDEYSRHRIYAIAPLVFNCAAGKDRTGVLAALLLTALGVSRQSVMDDYLLTERFFDRCCGMFMERRGNASFVGLPSEAWHPMLRADSAYLTAMFDQFDSAHGSTEGYLRDELGVDLAFMERLRSRMLED